VKLILGNFPKLVLQKFFKVISEFELIKYKGRLNHFIS